MQILPELILHHHFVGRETDAFAKHIKNFQNLSVDKDEDTVIHAVEEKERKHH